MTQRVDYDRIAGVYEGRYERNDYAGIERAVVAFVSSSSRTALRILEIGCGTGRWMRVLRDGGTPVIGIDPSAGMLQQARARLPDGRLIRAQAEALPFATGSLDRLLCVNALHHFTDRQAFFREARRVLRDDGALLTVGLDPHTGVDRWWIYDYFPTALDEDRRRYLPAGTIRELMVAAGFSRCETNEVQHRPVQMTISEAVRRGFLERTSTSQLMVISDAEYAAGLRRIHGADAAALGGVLRADLRVYGTTGWAAQPLS
jgi:SAM-dependent methyltransferase